MPVSTCATCPGTPAWGSRAMGVIASAVARGDTWGSRAMGVIASAVVRGDSIDGADALRPGHSEAAMGQWMPAPLTIGAYLRSCTWADTRSLDAVAAKVVARAWRAGGGGPGAAQAAPRSPTSPAASTGSAPLSLAAEPACPPADEHPSSVDDLTGGWVLSGAHDGSSVGAESSAMTGRPSWRTGVRAVLGVCAILTIPSYFLVDRATNALPPGHRFAGFVNLLEPATGTFPTADTVTLQVEALTPGGAGAHPLVEIQVLACGTVPFHGILLLGGAARLIDPRLVIFPTPTTAGALGPVFKPRTIGGPLVSLTQSVLPVADAQAIPVTIDKLATCPPTVGAGLQAADPIFGTPFALIGRFGEPVLRTYRVGPLEGPHEGQTWPLLGAFSDSLRGESQFIGPVSMAGEWNRPIPLRIGVDVAGTLTPRAELSSARPSSSSAEGLEWRSLEPMEPVARLFNADALARWQAWLALTTIALAVGASGMAAFLFEASRRPATASDRPNERVHDAVGTVRTADSNGPVSTLRRRARLVLSAAALVVVGTLWRRRR